MTAHHWAQGQGGSPLMAADRNYCVKRSLERPWQQSINPNSSWLSPLRCLLSQICNHCKTRRWEGRTVSLGLSTGVSWQCQKTLCCNKRNSRVEKQRVSIEIHPLNLRELGKIPVFTSPWFDSSHHSSSLKKKKQNKKPTPKQQQQNPENKNMFLRTGKTVTSQCCVPQAALALMNYCCLSPHHCKARWMREAILWEEVSGISIQG